MARAWAAWAAILAKGTALPFFWTCIHLCSDWEWAGGGGLGDNGFGGEEMVVRITMGVSTDGRSGAGMAVAPWVSQCLRMQSREAGVHS